MTTTNRAITQETSPRYSLTNVTLTALGPVTPYLLSRFSDRIIGRRVADNKLVYSDDGMLTWSVTGFANGFAIQNVVETHDGEILVQAGQGSQLNPNYIFKSSGWSSNPQTATFNQKLYVTSGVDSLWGFTKNGFGSDGVGFVTTYGATTVAGGAGANPDKGHYSFITRNHGDTFEPFLDILNLGTGVVNAAGVHWHGVAYYAPHKRVVMTFGDNTGNGRDIPGAGFTQLLIYDLDTMAISFYPIATEYAGLSGGNIQQFTGVKFSEDGSIILTPDAKPYFTIVIPSTGYRTYGAMHGVAVTGPESAEHIGGAIVHAKAGNPYLQSSGLSNVSNSTPGSVPALYGSVDGISWQLLWADSDHRVPAYGAGAIRPLGVLSNGKLIARYVNTGGAFPSAILTGTLTLN